MAWELLAPWFWSGLPLPPRLPSPFSSFQTPDGGSRSVESCSEGDASSLCPETSVSLGSICSVIAITQLLLCLPSQSVNF